VKLCIEIDRSHAVSDLTDGGDTGGAARLNRRARGDDRGIAFVVNEDAAASDGRARGTDKVHRRIAPAGPVDWKPTPVKAPTQTSVVGVVGMPVVAGGLEGAGPGAHCAMATPGASNAPAMPPPRPANAVVASMLVASKETRVRAMAPLVSDMERSRGRSRDTT
jgi:hypothetical protein